MAKETETVDINEKVAATQQSDGELTYERIIKKCIASGWVRKNNLKVKNVTVTDKSDYTMVSFTVVPPIDGYVQDELTGQYKKGLVNVIYSSSYAISGCIKENENLSWITKIITKDPEAINDFFNGGTIDILQLEVKEGEEFINPFSSKQESTPVKHDTIITIVINITLSENGKEMVTMIRSQRALKYANM